MKEDLLTENFRLREALEFYAKKENWDVYGSNATADGGHLARRALSRGHSLCVVCGKDGARMGIAADGCTYYLCDPHWEKLQAWLGR